jgi:hypothetical protein
MPTTKSPAKRTAAKPRPKPEEPESDLEVLSRDDDSDSFVGRLFDEDEFTFHSQANDYLMMLAANGDIGAIVRLLHSLVLIEEVDGEDIDETRRRERSRFDECLSRQPDLRTERIMRLYSDILEAAGNAPSESSTD